MGDSRSTGPVGGKGVSTKALAAIPARLLRRVPPFTYMKMLAPFGLKYYRLQGMFLPALMRGEIDYVTSNR
jgi:hypothetical protein